MEILVHKAEQLLVDFKCSVFDKAFTTSNGTVCSKTVLVDFFDEKGRKKGDKEYGLVLPKDIYALIKKGEAVCLDDCYIKNFSLATYRKNNHLDENQVVTLHDLSAKNTFFDGDTEVDFSYTKFENSGKLVFESSIFGSGKISFNHTHFGNEGVKSMKNEPIMF